MMFALALVGMLTHISLPAYNTMSSGLQQHAAARDLAQALRTARSEALLRNQVVRLQALEDNWSNGWRMVVEQDGPLLLYEQRFERVSIVGNQPVARQVRFSGLGVPMHEGGAFQAGTLFICQRPDPFSQYRVVLAPTGRVSLREEPGEQPLCAAGGSDQ
ncbi:type II secretion system protein [Pseudomonas tructae]|uniref:Type II secretion system protein H n=1 Tax=Pseudomonas tructae TaxID=2518644 RepID=A0A411MNW8_9PSED|nr:GspH/FimT family protein [Pseudomonas tructae]QBF28515.1 type II secretion system protein [Pseudomonas tructae]